MRTIRKIEGGHTRVKTPLVKKGFFYKPLHAEPQSTSLSIREFDKANNDFLEYRYKNRSKEEKERKKQSMPPERLFAIARRKLSDRKSDEDIREALDDISHANTKGADISPALDDLHSLKKFDDYWHIAASILADYYIHKRRREKLIELIEDDDPAVRVTTLLSLSLEVDNNADISFYVPVVYPLMRDIDESVADMASEFLIQCAMSKNAKVREAFLELRSDMLGEMLREMDSE